jgi:hypothetical protein
MFHKQTVLYSECLLCLSENSNDITSNQIVFDIIPKSNNAIIELNNRITQ